MNAVLSNPNHPEYGQVTIPLPIPKGMLILLFTYLNRTQSTVLYCGSIQVCEFCL